MTAKPDPLIHPITRLSICGLLAAGADWVEFAALRDAAGISDSVLSKQSRVLEDAGYVEVRKGAVGRRPRTWFRLTAEGREAVEGHLAWPSWRRRSRPAPGMCSRRGPSLVIATNRAAYCRLCWGALLELVLTYAASRAFQDRNVTFEPSAGSRRAEGAAGQAARTEQRPTPLPHPVSVTTRAWLVLAVVVLAGMIVISLRAPSLRLDDQVNTAVLRLFARARTPWLTGAARGISAASIPAGGHGGRSCRRSR